MKSTRLAVLLISFMVFSCQQESKEELTSINGGFISYIIDIKSDRVEFIDQVESIELLGFEETDESLLTPSAAFLPYSKGYIVIDESTGTVSFFSPDGSFEFKFNHQGVGPEEYQNMQHTNYRDGLIETYVYNTQKMMQYSLSGTFIQALDLPHQATDVFFFDKGYLLGMGNQFWLDSIDHNLVLADNDMKPYVYALPFNKLEGVPVKPPINDFRIDGDRALFNPFWSDSVYQVKDDKVSPYIHFDFGEEWLWNEFPMTRSLDGKTINALTDAGKVWTYDWVLSSDRIEMTYMTSLNLPPVSGYIDRETKNFYGYNHSWTDQEGLLFKSIQFIDEHLLAVFSPDILEAFVNALGKEKTEVIGKLSQKEILRSENPVLVKIKFK